MSSALLDKQQSNFIEKRIFTLLPCAFCYYSHRSKKQDSINRAIVVSLWCVLCLALCCARTAVFWSSCLLFLLPVCSPLSPCVDSWLKPLRSALRR